MMAHDVSPENAPFDEIIYCYNPITGWFCTKRVHGDDGKQFPLYNWDGTAGVWFPKVKKWVTETIYYSDGFVP